MRCFFIDCRLDRRGGRPMVAPTGIVGTQIHNVGAGIARPFPTAFAAPNCLPLAEREGKVSAQPTDEVIFQRRIQIKQAEIASARPAAYSVVSAAVPNRAAAITVSVTASVRH